MREPDFYVGYLPAPPTLARRTRRTALLLVFSGAALAVALAVATGPFAPSSFEFTRERELHGVIEADPVPFLLLLRREPGSAFGDLERIPLVAPGKHGAGPHVAAFAGAPVSLRGKRIERSGRTMLELVPGSIARLEAPSAPPATSAIENLGSVTLSGEIVDSKCFLGVMNPGQSEVHRACAIRCISGGIPPLLVATDVSGRAAQVLLVSATGTPVNRQVLELVARPVRVSGRLERRDDWFYLYADPASYELLP